MLAILFLQPSEPDGAPRFTHFRNPSSLAAVRCPFTQSIQSVGVSTGQRLSTESRSPLIWRHKLHQRQSCPYSTSFARTGATRALRGIGQRYLDRLYPVKKRFTTPLLRPVSGVEPRIFS